MKKVLIFDTQLNGHHLEYLHHYYIDALKHSTNEYIFVIPKSFVEKSRTMVWKIAKNISFDYISDNDINNIESASSISKSSFQSSKILKKYIKKHAPTNVVLTNLINHLPYMMLMSDQRIKLRGVIYRIYLYEWHKMHFLTKMLNAFKFYILSRCSCVEQVFILNDSSAAACFNKIFKTKKFRYLPDPYVECNRQATNIREELGVKKDKKLFIHFGALDIRKGTLKILEAIERIPIDKRTQYAFVFAGRVSSVMKEIFYAKVHQLEPTTQIIVKDEFVSFEFLASLCYSCDAILIPYSSPIQSSGVIGYAAQYNKPVIGSGEGLLGKIIKRFHLGIIVSEINPDSLSKVILQTKIHPISGDEYLKTNTVDAFNKIIMDI